MRINKIFILVTLSVCLLCPKSHGQFIEIFIAKKADDREQHKRDCQAAGEQYGAVTNNISLKNQAATEAKKALDEALAHTVSLSLHESEVETDYKNLKKLFDNVEQGSKYTGQWQLLLDSAKENIRGDQRRLSSWKSAIENLQRQLKQSHKPIANSPMTVNYWRDKLDSNPNSQSEADQFKTQVELLKMLDEGIDAAMKSSAGDLTIYSAGVFDARSMIMGLAQLTSDLLVHLQKEDEEYKVEIKATSDNYLTRVAEYSSISLELSQLNAVQADVARKICR